MTEQEKSPEIRSIGEPYINPLGNKVSNRDIDGELAELQETLPLTPQVSSKIGSRRWRNGMPLWEIFKDEPDRLADLTAELPDHPPLHQRNLDRRRRQLEILSSDEP